MNDFMKKKKINGTLCMNKLIHIKKQKEPYKKVC